jgi:putative flippase GtrA
MSRRFSRFLVVGAIGFLADAGALALLLAMTPLDPYSARLVAIVFALSVTWLINRSFTFSPSSRGMAREGARYGGVGIGASLINYAAYAAALALVPSLPPLAALVFGSLVAITASYLGYSRFVFDR